MLAEGPREDPPMPPSAPAGDLFTLHILVACPSSLCFLKLKKIISVAMYTCLCVLMCKCSCTGVCVYMHVEDRGQGQVSLSIVLHLHF